MVYFNAPVIAHELGEVVRCRLGRRQGGDDVDGLAGDLPGPGVLSPAGELDRLMDVREVDAQEVDVDGLQGAGVDAAVAGLGVSSLRSGSSSTAKLCPWLQQRLVLLDDGDVVPVLGRHQPFQGREAG